MSYGIEIQNSDGRVQIAEDFSNVFIQSSGSASRGASFPPTGFSAAAGDIVISRATTTGYTSVGGSGNSGTFGLTNTSQTQFDDAAAFQWKILRPFAGNVSSSSDYGIEVFTADGDLTYSTSKENFVRIATVGAMSGSGTVRYPATGTIDLSKHYCMLSRTGLGHFYLETEITFELGTFIIASENMQGFQYNYTSGNNGHIVVTNKYISAGSESDNGPFQYIIFETVE